MLIDEKIITMLLLCDNNNKNNNNADRKECVTNIDKVVPTHHPNNDHVAETSEKLLGISL